MPEPMDTKETGTAPAPPRLCSKCKTRPTYRATGKGWCRECDRAADAQRQKQKTAAPPPPPPEISSVPVARCPDCHEPLPHRKWMSGACPARRYRTEIDRGRDRLNDAWPGYGSRITDEAFLARAGRFGGAWPPARWPAPSTVFPGIDPALDRRILHDGRDKDVALCDALAVVPTRAQREFYELALIDLADARHWLALPPWKRTIRKGDADDHLIWKFFTMLRLRMEHGARGIAWSMASQGAELPQMFGMIARLSPAGVQKLVLVMNAYGTGLRDGADLGDVVKPPWQDGR